MLTSNILDWTTLLKHCKCLLVLMLFSPFDSYWVLLSTVKSNWVPLTPIEYHWLLLSTVNSNWVPLTPIEYHWLLLSTIESYWLRAQSKSVVELWNAPLWHIIRNPNAALPTCSLQELTNNQTTTVCVRVLVCEFAHNVCVSVCACSRVAQIKCSRVAQIKMN
jgi:hypothetical protein